MIRHDPGNELLHAFHAVFDQRKSVKLEGIFDPAFEQGLFVEGDGDVFVGLGHGLSPWSEHRVGVGGRSSETGWITSQCSTILRFSSRKMSTMASPRASGVRLRCTR